MNQLIFFNIVLIVILCFVIYPLAVLYVSINFIFFFGVIIWNLVIYIKDQGEVKMGEQMKKRILFCTAMLSSNVLALLFYKVTSSIYSLFF